MNCEWEDQVALYADGGPAPADARAVERHLAECAACRLLLKEVRESLDLLRQAHAEPLDAAHFAAVRAGVLAGIGRRSARRRWYAWMPAPAALAAALLMALWPRPAVRLMLPLPPGPPAPHIARVDLAPAAPAGTRRPPARPSGTVLVKIETDNPDVVIYWIAETKGEDK